MKTRTRDYVADKKDAIVFRVSGATPDTERMKRGAKRGVGAAKENPLGLALGGVAVGFLAGMLAPSTRVEDERIGEVADQAKERAQEVGQEAIDRGKQVVQEAGQSAVETGKERGQEQVERGKERAQQEVGTGAQPGGAPGGGQFRG